MSVFEVGDLVRIELDNTLQQIYLPKIYHGAYGVIVNIKTHENHDMMVYHVRCFSIGEKVPLYCWEMRKIS